MRVPVYVQGQFGQEIMKNSASSGNRKIDVVIFDFGGVFTESPFHVIEDAGAALGVLPGQLARIMFGPYDQDTNHPWHRLERGEISLDRAMQEIRIMGKREGIDFDPLEILLSIGGGDGDGNPLVDRVRRLKEDGYQTAVITNNIAEFRDLWRELLPVDDLFDLIIDSSVEGMRKPDPQIFRITLSRLGDIAPERAVFLDDYESNIRVARRLGIRGVLVGEDKLKAIQELDGILAE